MLSFASYVPRTTIFMSSKRTSTSVLARRTIIYGVARQNEADHNLILTGFRLLVEANC